jgi:hypothetical protein
MAAAWRTLASSPSAGAAVDEASLYRRFGISRQTVWQCQAQRFEDVTIGVHRDEHPARLTSVSPLTAPPARWGSDRALAASRTWLVSQVCQSMKPG